MRRGLPSAGPARRPPRSRPRWRTSSGNFMKLLVVVGTRPEAIKMAPVIRRLRAEAGAHGRPLRDRAASRDARPGVLSLRDPARHRPRPHAPGPDAQRARGARPVGPRRGPRARSPGLAPRAGRHDDGDGGLAGRVPPARARRARRGRPPHGRLPAPLSRGDEPARRGSRLGGQLRSDAPRRPRPRGRGGPGGEDLPDGKHGRGRARRRSRAAKATSPRRTSSSSPRTAARASASRSSASCARSAASRAGSPRPVSST